MNALPWKCVRCGTEYGPDQAEPIVDDFGAHFMCSNCGRRNNLRATRDTDGALLLEQVDPPH